LAVGFCPKNSGFARVWGAAAPQPPRSYAYVCRTVWPRNLSVCECTLAASSNMNECTLRPSKSPSECDAGRRRIALRFFFASSLMHDFSRRHCNLGRSIIVEFRFRPPSSFNHSGRQRTSTLGCCTSSETVTVNNESDYRTNVSK